MSTKTLPALKNITAVFSRLTEKAKLRRTPLTEEDLAEKARNDELFRLKTELCSVRKEINTITAQFNDACEPECIAYYAYLLKATEAKYDYLLRLARESVAETEKTAL
jgi:hypothetical protein